VRRNRCSYPLPLSWQRQKKDNGRVMFSFVLSFVLPFVTFLGAQLLFLGTGGRGHGGACNGPLCVVCG